MVLISGSSSSIGRPRSAQIFVLVPGFDPLWKAAGADGLEEGLPERAAHEPVDHRVQGTVYRHEEKGEKTLKGTPISIPFLFTSSL